MTDKRLEEKIFDLGKESPFKERSEVGEVFQNLDTDEPHRETRMSNIDFNARLSSLDISNCMIIDELQSLGILPELARLTRQKKRLSVSFEGRGRQEKVEIASASRGADLSGKSGGFLASLFSKRE